MSHSGKILAFTISAHNPYKRLAQKVFSYELPVKNHNASGTGFQPVDSAWENQHDFYRPEACATKLNPE
jgi:hypothetical protein